MARSSAPTEVLLEMTYPPDVALAEPLSRVEYLDFDTYRRIILTREQQEAETNYEIADKNR